MLFNNLDRATQRKIVGEMYERRVAAGEILISQGDIGASASQLYVVKSGKFEVSPLSRPLVAKVHRPLCRPAALLHLH